MISVIRLTLSRSTSPQVLRVAGVALIVLVAVMAAAPVVRGRVVKAKVCARCIRTASKVG